MYYKCVIALASALARVINYTPRVVNYAPRVVLQIVASLTIVIYDRIMFMLQATSFLTNAFYYIRKLQPQITYNITLGTIKLFTGII
jgi:hypothetical protein